MKYTTLSLILAAAVMAEDKKTDEPKLLFDKDVTVGALGKVACENLTADLLNGIEKKEVCKILDADCLIKFDTTNISGKCLDAISTREWGKFDIKTVKEILASKPTAFHLTQKKLQAISKNFENEGVDVPNGFASYVLGDADLVEVIFETSDAKIFNKFFTAESLRGAEPTIFRRFGKNLIKSLKDDAFSKVDGFRLALIPSANFEGFTPAQWKLINPEALESLKKSHMKALNKECWNEMSNDQINRLGEPLTKATPIKGLSDEDEQKVNALVDRHHFKEHHACNAFEEIKENITEEKRAIFAQKCDPVAKFDANSGSWVGTSLKATAAILAFAVVPTFFF